MRRASSTLTIATAFVMAMVWVVPRAVLGQDAAASSQAKPKSMAMPRDAKPDWEVATVKASDPNDARGQHIQMRGRYMLLLDTTVEEFLLLGYAVQKSQLAGLPEWAKTEKWDVSGIPDTEGTPSLTQLEGMMQKILAERFSVKLHHEQRELPVFALSIAKGGPKITPNTSDPNGWLDQPAARLSPTLNEIATFG